MSVDLYLGRRNYFLECVWYSAAVYEANEKILSVKFSPNSKGYYKTTLPKKDSTDTYQEIGDDTTTTNTEFYDDSAMVDINNVYRFPLVNGTFFAKNLTPLSEDTKEVNNNLQIATQEIQLETNDKLDGMQKNDYIFFNHVFWIVRSIQVRKVYNNQQFNSFDSSSSTRVITISR